MNPILYINAGIEEPYAEYNFWRRLKDRVSVRLQGREFITELGLTITNIKLPPNFDERAYHHNIKIATKFVKCETWLAPKTHRLLDYSLLNSFQKELMGFSVAKSIQLMLRIRKKSIRNSCIVIYDASETINNSIIFQMAKEAKYLVFLSENIRECNVLRDYVVTNYGVSPIITTDFRYAIEKADFIVASRPLKGVLEKPIWYVDNFYTPSMKNKFAVNDVAYSTPWREKSFMMAPELLGAILSQMEEKDIEKSLKNNGVFLEQIKFNDSIKESAEL